MRLVVLTALFTSVDALARFADKLPNGDNDKLHALGHKNRVDGGGDLNAFGEAFKKQGFRWTLALCQADSDGDGQTNGQELGDPCCSWIETTNLAYNGRYISDPSDAASRVDPSIFKSIQCTKSEAAVNAANQKAKNTTKPSITTRAPTKIDNTNDNYDDSGSGSDSVSVNRTMGDRQQKPSTQSSSVAVPETATAASLAVGLIVAWALL